MKGKEEKRRRTVRNAQVGLWAALILIQMVVVNCLTVRAEIIGDGQQAQIQAQAHQAQIQQERQAQEQEPIRRRVQRDVVYEAVEGATELPETVDIEVRQDKQTVIAVCTMQEKAVLREWWSDDFSFPITFHTYDAEFYELGERVIPYNEERPQLDGCEEQLLETIGVSPQEYEITDLQWSGEVYQGADGQLCRDAAARGRKLLRDYRVRYTGTVVLPVHRELPAELQETEDTEDTGENMQESTWDSEVLQSMEEPVVRIEPQEDGEAPLTFWQKLTRTLLIVIGIGALMFFGGLLLLALLWVVKRLQKWYTGRRK